MKEYLCEKEEVLSNYDSSEKGLTQAQADERLQKNGKNKLAEAKKEVTKIDEYDYILINDEVDKCVENLVAIIKAERNKKSRNTDIISKLSEETNNDD